MKNYLLILIACFALSLCKVSAQTNGPVTLQWKLSPKEKLVYNTTLQDIDTTKISLLKFDGLFDKTDVVKKDSVEKMFKELNKRFNDKTMVTTLTENTKGVVEVVMILEDSKKEKKKKEDKDWPQELFDKMNGKVMLRGRIFTTGGVESFYLKNDQKNLLAMLFELPKVPVKVGDSWALDINLLSMDHNFVCDSSMRQNKVSLVEVKTDGSNQIAVLQYNIEEYAGGKFGNPVSGKNEDVSMYMYYKGFAEFNIDKGRWEKFNGVLSLTSTGLMDSSVSKNVQLEPVKN